jgi:hypothetical protein
VENNRAFVSRLPFLVVLLILALATICAAAAQLSDRLPLSPWESAVVMEAVRLNAGLPVYETAHATHMYGPLLTVLLAGVFQVFGFNVLAARIVMSIFAFALAILLSAIFCTGKSRACWAIAVLLFLGINFRTNLIFFSTQADGVAALLAVVALYFWATRKSSLLFSLASIALFLCATLCKQTSAAFALIAFVYVLMWRRPLQLHELVPPLAPTMSILLALAAIRSARPQMFAAMVTIPASIKVYPERALNVSLYLFATFPIFLIALWSIWRSRNSITAPERWILSALIVLVPISIWTICKSGGGYNSLLFAYLAMTALFVARLDAIFDWLRSLSIQRSFVAAIAIALAILASFFLQFDQTVALLSVRHGDEKYDTAVALARNLNDVVSSPQDPTIAYRAKNYIGRSLFFELDAHAVNGNWPSELPMSILQELHQANYVIEVHSYVPTPTFAPTLAANGFHALDVSELRDSAYTVWSRTIPQDGLP